MPTRGTQRYFFIIQWPDHQHDDPHGTDFPNPEAALKYAERIVRELKEAGGYDDPGLCMVVKNRVRKTLFSVPFLNDAI